ncbi:MAG: phosphodiester glycosidase family protein [Armatimonadetes bacterium]|nr:phosphodiester glycosidase family protein [Armatimonadota bacterium]
MAFSGKAGRRLRAAVAGVWLLIGAVAGGVWGADTVYRRHLAPGVALEQRLRTGPRPLIVTAFRVSTQAPGVKMRAALGGDAVAGTDATRGREAVSRLAARLGARAAVNADFFPWTGDPLGLHITGGQIVSDPDPRRAAVGVTADGRVLLDVVSFRGECEAEGQAVALTGINRARQEGDLILYTPAYGPSTLTDAQGVEVRLGTSAAGFRSGSAIRGEVIEAPTGKGNAPIPADGCVLSARGAAAGFLDRLEAGAAVTIRLSLKGARPGWDRVAEAVGGGPWLVRAGQAAIDTVAEGFDTSFAATRHPRTAVGVTAGGELLMVAVDGRQAISAGASLAEMAQVMRELGAVEAINLDGGGSTTAVAEGMVVNSPSGGAERPVANALLVLAEGAAPAEAALPDLPGEAQIQSGKTLALGGGAAQAAGSGAGSGVWGVRGGIGFVDQGGRFTAGRAGAGQVVFRAGAAERSVAVSVRPGAAVRLTARWAEDALAIPNVSRVRVAAFDAFGNPVPGQAVAVEPAGGVADAGTVTTGTRGEAEVTLTWESPPAGRSVAVRLPGSKPVTLRYPAGDASGKTSTARAGTAAP